MTLVGWETSVHVCLKAMFGYRPCLENLNVLLENVTGCGCGCGQSVLEPPEYATDPMLLNTKITNIFLPCHKAEKKHFTL